jgi:uncharacterized repeat protein (TIGR03803 family)
MTTRAGRFKSTMRIGSKRRSIALLRPMATPSTVPKAIASVKDATTRASVIARLRKSAPERASDLITARTASGAGSNQYGTIRYGGASGYGTVFELSPPAISGGTWTETVLHSFSGYPSDGAAPSASLIADSKGNLYGTTRYGGASTSNNGVVFELSPPAISDGAWTKTVLHAAQFSHPEFGGSGQWMRGGMIMVSDMFNIKNSS